MSARMAEKPPPNCRPTAGLLHRYSPMTAPTPPARRSRVTNGALFVEGLPDDVARDPRVKAVYLGEEADA